MKQERMMGETMRWFQLLRTDPRKMEISKESGEEDVAISDYSSSWSDSKEHSLVESEDSDEMY